MILESTDILAIIIALVGACIAIIWSIQDNRNLRKYIAYLEAKVTRDSVDQYLLDREERLNAKKNSLS